VIMVSVGVLARFEVKPGLEAEAAEEVRPSVQVLTRTKPRRPASGAESDGSPSGTVALK
jgi:hypothetical protein